MSLSLTRDIQAISEKAHWTRELQDIADAIAEDDKFGLLGIEFMWHHLHSDEFDEAWLPDRSVLEAWAAAFVLSTGIWMHREYPGIEIELVDDTG